MIRIKPSLRQASICAVAIACASLGCSSSSSPDDPLQAIPALAAKAKRANGPFGPDRERKHHFGSVVSDSAGFKHVYQVANRSDKTLRITGAQNLKPCCGEVWLKPGPTLLEPGQSVELTVRLLANKTMTEEIVHFAAIETDHPDWPTLTFETRALAHPRFFVEGVDPSALSIHPGTPLTARYPVIALGTAQQPPFDLDRMEIKSQLKAYWADAAQSNPREDQLLESKRIVMIEFPTNSDPAVHADEVQFRLDDAVMAAIPLRWEVREAVKASPSVLAFDRSNPSAKTVIISADGDQPFQIESAVSNLPGLSAAFDPKASKTVHSLRLTRTAGNEAAPKTGEVEVTTNHPSQKRVRISVYVAGASKP